MEELKLIVTNKCNLNCSYCYEKHKGKSAMTKEVAMDAIDSFTENAESNTRLDLSFHGGEPLLEFEIIKYATEYLKEKSSLKKLDPHFGITTNGTLVTPEIAQYFKENNFRVKVSLDGKEETHNLHRKTIDSHDTYNKVVKAAYLLNENECDLSIRMTITPETVDSFVENVQWLLEKGFRKIEAVADNLADWSKKIDKLEASYKEIQRIYIDRLEKDRFSFGMFDGKIAQYLQARKPRFCNAGFGHFVVNPDGTLYPCAYVMDKKEFCVGKLKGEIDKKKRKRYIEKHLTKNDICEECSIAHFCQGRKCSFNNYITTGYLNLSNDFWCKHEKMLYKIVEEIVDVLCIKKDTTIMKMLECIKNNPEIIPNDSVKKYLQA